MKRLAATLGLAVLGAAAVPALAADETITAQDYAFDRETVTIDVGDTVTFGNAGGFHNFDFGDQAIPAQPTSSNDAVWDTPLTRTFTTPGDFAFHCDAHAGMTGRVIVRDPSSNPSPSPTPTPTPAPGAGSQPAAPAIRSLRLGAAAFCSSRSRGCRRPGVAVRIDLSVPAHVRGTLRRGRRKAGGVDLGTVAAGPRTLRFGRRLKPGRYVLRLRAADLAPRTLRFTIRA